MVSEWTDGSERQAPRFRVVPYDQPRGCAAAYYPETNPLVPLDHVAEGSNCPSSKSVIIRLDPTPDGGVGVQHSGTGTASGDAGRVESGGNKRTPDPDQLG